MNSKFPPAFSPTFKARLGNETKNAGVGTGTFRNIIGTETSHQNPFLIFSREPEPEPEPVHILPENRIAKPRNRYGIRRGSRFVRSLPIVYARSGRNRKLEHEQ